MTDNSIKELRLKGSSTILDYLRKFSATEKVVFGILAVAAAITAIVMTAEANSYFMSEVPADGGSLNEGLVGLPHTVNPILAVTDVDRDISALVYSGLTRIKDSQIVPDLAESWDISPDGLTYTFKLRPDLTFQNGSKLTADDVVFTISRIKDYALKSPRAADWAGVTVQAASPSTIVFTLRQPYSSFLANTTVGIVPKSIWGSVSDEQFIFSEYNIRPIGAGPYKIVSIKRDQGGIPTSYTLEAWDDYHAGRAHLTNVTFTFFPDLDHALSALGNGSIQSLSSIPPAVARDLAANKGEPYEVAATPLTRIFGVFFNQNKNSLLASETVRKALDMSADRSALVESILYGYGVPLQSPFPAGFDIGTSTAVSKPDLQAAQNLLIKNGWKMGPSGIFEKKASRTSATTTLAFTLHTADTADLKQAAELLKAQWQKLGAGVTVRVLPPTELYQSIIRTRDYDALLFGQVVGKSSDFYAFWHSSQRNSPGLNIAMYTNSRADRILEQVRAATSSAERTSLYGELDRIISDEVPAVFLYSPQLTYAVPKRLEGLRLSVTTAPLDRFQNITDWYMEMERVWNIFKR